MGINRSERQRGLRGADKDASSRAAHVHGPLQMRVRLGEELLTGCICAGGRGMGLWGVRSRQVLWCLSIKIQ